MQLSEIKLERCPACGAEALLVQGGRRGGWNVLCTDFYCPCAILGCRTMEEAAVMWNKKAKEAKEAKRGG